MGTGSSEEGPPPLGQGTGRLLPAPGFSPVEFDIPLISAVMTDGLIPNQQEGRNRKQRGLHGRVVGGRGSWG